MLLLFFFLKQILIQRWKNDVAGDPEAEQECCGVTLTKGVSLRGLQAQGRDRSDDMRARENDSDQ